MNSNSDRLSSLTFSSGVLLSICLIGSFVIGGASTLSLENRYHPNAGNSDITVETVTTYGSIDDSDPSQPIIGAIWYPTIDDEGNIYLLDFQAMHILSFSNSGEFRWKVGARGEGPGELTWPQGLYWDGSSLVLLNHRGARIDRLDKDGNWLDPLQTAQKTTGITISGVLNDSIIVTNGPRPGVIGSYIVFRRKLDWDVIDTLQIDFPDEVEGLRGFLNLTPPVGVYGNQVVVGSYSKDNLYFYDAAGNPINSWDIGRHRLMAPIVWKQEETEMVVKFNLVDPPVRISEELSVIRYLLPPDGVNRQSAGPEVELRIGENFEYDFYDNEKNLVAEFDKSTPEGQLLRGIIFAAQDGYVYVSKNHPSPHVAKLRIQRK